jgi:hypothetical protein
LTGDFDLKVLHAALDSQRRARGLTWAQATREIGAVGAVPRRPIATSTITGLTTKRVAEADGVLQMLRWLERPPESFVPGHPLAELTSANLPEADAREVLRFDTHKLYEALDARRVTLGLTWQQMASLIGVPATHMRGLAKGGRTAFPDVMRLTAWLRHPVAQFVRVSSY